MFIGIDVACGNKNWFVEESGKGFTKTGDTHKKQEESDSETHNHNVNIVMEVLK